jgi:hypothetical protein
MARFLTVGFLMMAMSLLAMAGPRQAAQGARIRQGVRSGSLTRVEAARLRTGVRVANPTQNSRAIARFKHNGRIR